MRYPRPLDSDIREPHGRRGRSPGIATWYWGVGGGEYFEKADVWPLNGNGNLLAIIQIESPGAVERIDEIVTTPGVGGGRSRTSLCFAARMHPCTMQNGGARSATRRAGGRMAEPNPAPATKFLFLDQHLTG